MSIGAALLTVALLISLIVEPELMTLRMGMAGAAVGFTGMLMWAGKYGCLLNEREKAAARNISIALRA